MTVELGIAVTGKVFAAGEDTALVEPMRECERVLDHAIRRAPERAISDHRIERIRVDVEDWRKVQVDANRTQLPAEDGGRVPGQCRTRCGGERSHRRKSQHGFTETGDATTFLVDAHQDGE